MSRVYYYEDDPLKIFESLARYEFARPYVKDAFVLDIGCGARKGPLVLAQNAKEVIGSDISKEAVSYSARKWRSEDLKYVASDAVALSFADRVFDIVISFEVLEHIRQQEQFLQEAKRVLKKDGLFILSTPNKSVMSPQGVFQNPDHVREFSAPELKEFLLSIFSRVDLYGQKPSAKVGEVLECRKESYQKVGLIPVFLRRIFQKTLKQYLFKAYVSFCSMARKKIRQEDISEADFPISSGAIEEAHYLLAVCRV